MLANLPNLRGALVRKFNRLQALCVGVENPFTVSDRAGAPLGLGISNERSVLGLRDFLEKNERDCFRRLGDVCHFLNSVLGWVAPHRIEASGWAVMAWPFAKEADPRAASEAA